MGRDHLEYLIDTGLDLIRPRAGSCEHDFSWSGGEFGPMVILICTFNVMFIQNVWEVLIHSSASTKNAKTTVRTKALINMKSKEN
jgi:hypothetical protein